MHSPSDAVHCPSDAVHCGAVTERRSGALAGGTHPRRERPLRRSRLAVGETVTLMTPPSTFSRVSIQTDRGFIKMTVSPTARLQLGAGAAALDCPLPEVRRNCRRRLRRPALHRRAPRPPGRPTDRPSWPGPSRLAGGHPQCVPDKVHSSELPRRLCPPAAAVPLRGPRSARGCQGRYSRGRLAPTGGGGAADARAAATTRGRGGLHG